MRPAARLTHPALETGLDLLALGAAPLTGRQRLAVVLQGAGLLSLLARAGWHLPTGWSEAGVTAAGRLALRRPQAAAPGRAALLPQELLRDLLGMLFGTAGEQGKDGRPGSLAGRGEALRAARELLAAWRQTLVPLAPDTAVAQILESSPFLWSPAFAAARRGLAGEIEGDSARQLWVAGSGPFGRRLLASA